MSFNGNAISSYIVGVTLRRSRFSRIAPLAEKIVLCTGRGASACVPTCGLEVNKDTLTLAPAPIRDDHPQVNGVSPGHSGVSAFRVTLMSFRRGSEPFISLKSRRASGPYFLPIRFFA